MSKMEELIKKINKETDNIMSIGLPEYEYERIPFSSPRMNYCTYGGLPVGTLVEFFGEQHGGKTTTALDIVANYQQMETGKKVLYCDCENTLDRVWASKIGVDLDNIYLLQPKAESAETIFQYILDAINTDEIGLVVIDSLAAMVSQQELEKDAGEKTYGGISMALTRFSKKAEMACHKHRCTLIGINQMREVIGSMFPMEDTPGGKAWKHMCSVRLEFRRGKFIDDKGNELNRGAENPHGNIVMVSMHKNKSCPPSRRVGFYTINYETGVDWVKDLVDVGIKLGYIDKAGAWFKFIDADTGEVIKDKIQGQANVYAVLNEDEELFNWFRDKIYEKLDKE